MGFGVMQAPLIDLTVVSAPAFGVPTSGRSVSAMPAGNIRGSRNHRQPSTPSRSSRRSCAVVAGTARSGKTALVDALIRRTAEPIEAGDAWVVFRHGERPEAWAFVPGHREARPFPDHSTIKGPARPARRIEITHPSPLLKRLALIDTPGRGDLDPATCEISLDAAADGLGLVFVVDAAAPLGRAELDLLAAAADRLERIAFVLTHIDQHDEWPEMLAANRALLAARGPRLATAPWFPVSLEPASIFGVAELRHQLEAWSDERADAGVPKKVTATTVSATGDAWQEHLEREIRARRLAAVERVSIDLATIHVRCVQELGSGKGCPELPRVLDRQLHALSVRSSRQLRTDTREVIDAVFGALLDTPPDELVLTRIATAARRAVDGARDDGRERDRALLVTTTSGVASLTGAGALDGLCATGLAGGADPDPAQVLSPLGIGLNAGSFAMWQPRHAPGGPPKLPDKKDCRRWLQHALREIEVELGHELSERYAELRQALSIIAGDAVDHGVLLA
nr:dynamin family protein [Dactylosporangium thailandense]